MGEKQPDPKVVHLRALRDEAHKQRREANVASAKADMLAAKFNLALAEYEQEHGRPANLDGSG